jgi:hypothetical protein
VQVLYLAEVLQVSVGALFPKTQVRRRPFSPMPATRRRKAKGTRTAWFPVSDVPKLAFDHDTILEVALARLKAKVRYQPIGFELLPTKFTQKVSAIHQKTKP